MSKPKPTNKPTYTAEQKAKWKNTYRDFKSGSTRAGTALVMKFIPGKGSCLVALENWTAA